MKFLWVVSFVLFAVSAQASHGRKIVCRASGTVQSIDTVTIAYTDLEGQICAVSTDKKGAMNFFASDGSLEDAQILVARKSYSMDGDYTVYLTRSTDKDGKTTFALEEYYVCDEDNIEFCYGSNRKTPVKSKTDAGLKCKLIEE